MDGTTHISATSRFGFAYTRSEGGVSCATRFRNNCPRRGPPRPLPLDSLKKEEATVAAILRAGETILAGPDSPLDNVATALHLNLRAQVKFGLEPWRALQTATL